MCRWCGALARRALPAQDRVCDANISEQALSCAVARHSYLLALVLAQRTHCMRLRQGICCCFAGVTAQLRVSSSAPSTQLGVTGFDVWLPAGRCGTVAPGCADTRRISVMNDWSQRWRAWAPWRRLKRQRARLPESGCMRCLVVQQRVADRQLRRSRASLTACVHACMNTGSLSTSAS